ncbi:MAG: TadE/TadG family type IV pilus assembly protein [Longimicrobiales bacterium]|nr:TadE/TadG family type IV pilus assembly protein [Longimicrobiales bacterium]
MKTLRRFFGASDRGQAMVEFALTIPILLLILLGIADFARAWNVYEVLTDAGREATRLSVVDNGSTEQDVREVVKEAAYYAGITVTDSDIGIVEGATRGEPTTVTVTYDYQLQWVGWLLAPFMDSTTITFNVVSTMRRE